MSDGISLLPHNEEAYQKLISGLEDKQFVSINHATGTGKSFIISKYLSDNKDKRILYLSSTYAILEQLVNEHFDELGIDKSLFNKLDTMIYSNLLNIDVSNLAHQYDIIILDEYHRCGALKWGMKIDELINVIKGEKLPVKIIGTTATEIRYLDDEKNMNEILFDGNCVSRITLADAMLKGILPVPFYVNISFELIERLMIIEKRIKNSHLSNEAKNEYLLRIYQLQDEVEEVMKKERKLQEYLSPKGKYLVFSSKIDNIYHDQKLIQRLLPDIDNEYIVSSDETRKNNRINLKKFREASNNETTVLYSVNLLNEGVHVKDIDAIFMLRPTTSPIIYFQQLGRALSYSRRKDKVVIFDFVNNYRRHNIIYDVYIEVVKKANELMITDPENKERYQRIIDNFKIVDFSSQIVQKIDALDKETTYSKINERILDEAITILERSNDFEDFNVSMAYIELFRLQRFVTIDFYDRVNKLQLEKPKIFNVSRDEFCEYLGKYANVYQKDANKYKDLYKDVINFYKNEGRLPGIFNKSASERELAKRLLENFDKLSTKRQRDIVEKISNNLSVVELISYGVSDLPSNRLELYSQLDKLIQMNVIANLNLVGVLRKGRTDEDQRYTKKMISSNKYFEEMIDLEEEKFFGDDDIIKKTIDANKNIIGREKFFIISEMIKEEFSKAQNRERYLMDLVNQINNFIISKKRVIKFSFEEEIIPEDILYCKKVIFSQYLKKYDFNKLLLNPKKTKTISFDYLFDFMDSHQGGVPSDKNSDYSEKVLARKFNKNKEKMTESDISKFNQYKKKYEKERYMLLKEYLDFVKLYQRKPLPFNEYEISLRERYERIKTCMSLEEIEMVQEIFKGVDPEIERREILEQGLKRRERIKNKS